MADRINNAAPTNVSILAAVGGTINSNDSVYITHGGITYTGDLDQSAKDVDLLVFGKTFTGNVASGFWIDADKVVIAFSGDYIYIGTGDTNAVDVVEGRCNNPAARVYFTTGSTAVSTFPVVTWYAGVAVGTDTADFDDLKVYGGTFILEASPSGKVSAAVEVGQAGGPWGTATVTSARVITVATVNANGVLRYDESDGVATVTTLNMTGGHADLNVGATITTINGKAGHLDFSRLKKPLTVTTFNSYEGLRVTKPLSGVPITVTTFNAFGENAPRLN